MEQTVFLLCPLPICLLSLWANCHQIRLNLSHLSILSLCLRYSMMYHVTEMGSLISFRPTFTEVLLGWRGRNVWIVTRMKHEAVIGVINLTNYFIYWTGFGCDAVGSPGPGSVCKIWLTPSWRRKSKSHSAKEAVARNKGQLNGWDKVTLGFQKLSRKWVLETESSSFNRHRHNELCV